MSSKRQFNKGRRIRGKAEKRKSKKHTQTPHKHTQNNQPTTTKTCEWCKSNHSPPSTRRQMCSQPLGNGYLGIFTASFRNVTYCWAWRPSVSCGQLSCLCSLLTQTCSTLLVHLSHIRLFQMTSSRCEIVQKIGVLRNQHNWINCFLSYLSFYLLFVVSLLQCQSQM